MSEHLATAVIGNSFKRGRRRNRQDKKVQMKSCKSEIGRRKRLKEKEREKERKKEIL